MEPTGEYEISDRYSRDCPSPWDRLSELASDIHYRAEVLSDGGASPETVQRLLCEVDQFVVLGRRYLEDLRASDSRSTN